MGWKIKAIKSLQEQSKKAKRWKIVEKSKKMQWTSQRSNIQITGIPEREYGRYCRVLCQRPFLNHVAKHSCLVYLPPVECGLDHVIYFIQQDSSQYDTNKSLINTFTLECFFLDHFLKDSFSSWARLLKDEKPYEERLCGI